MNSSECVAMRGGVFVNASRGWIAVRERGFAYLWTLFLVAFMGVSLVIASEVYSTTLQREKERELIFIGREFRNAIGRYYESHMAGGQRQYPVALEDLLKDPRFPNGLRYLRRIYTDPMTGKSEWGVVLVSGRIAGVHSLSEREAIKQDNFESTEMGFQGKKKYSEWVFTYPPDLIHGLPKNTIGMDHVEATVPAAGAEKIMDQNVSRPFSDTE